MVSTKKLYPTAASLQAFAEGAGADRVTRAIYGPAGDLHTLGGLATWKLSVFGVVGVAVMSMFIVVRHTRGDEDAGRLELVGAGAVGRLAALTSGLLTALLANLGVALLVAVGLAVGGCPGSTRWRSGSGWPPPAVSSRRSPRVAAQLAGSRRAGHRHRNQRDRAGLPAAGGGRRGVARQLGRQPLLAVADRVEPAACGRSARSTGGCW